MGINNGNVFVEINTSNPITADYVETISAPLTYKKGWNMFGVYSDATDTRVYNVMYDGTTSSSGGITHTMQQFVDNTAYITCIGGRRTTTTTAQDSLKGMFSELRFYSDEVRLADLQSLVRFTCNNPCPICLTATNPNCIETLNTANIAKWDFARSTYVQTIPDTGPKGLNINLLNDQKSYDPIYVHNQGLYFDGTSHMRTVGGFAQNGVESITIEGWIKPSSSVLSGTLVGFEKANNNNDASLSFDKNSFEFDFAGTKTNIPLTYTAAMVDTWQYFGVSLHKIGPSQTKVCAVFGTGAESCQIVNKVLTFTAASEKIQIGSGFQGMIKEMNILDWPKVGYEFTSVYQTAGCVAWNGVSCSHCPSSTGRCLSTCAKGTYGNTCTACLNPYCSSCYGGTNTQCYE